MLRTLKAILIGSVLGIGLFLVTGMFPKRSESVPIVYNLESDVAGPNDSQTVRVTFVAPSPPDSLARVAVAIWQNGILRRYASYIPRKGDTITSSLRVGPPVPGHTASYVLGIITTVYPTRPVRMRAFYWERTNNSVAMVAEPTILPRVSIRWSNPVTAGVLGDSFRVWSRTYLFPNDTVGTSLLYQSTIFPGDTSFTPLHSLQIGRMYKFYGSVYLFGAERIRYPFFSVVVR